MTGSVPARVRWAVDVLDVGPDDRLLEIGCGHGAAISVICDRLREGTITALDRSATVARAARERNAAHVSAGRAAIHAADLTDAGLAPGRFTKVFAINVNLFWTRSAQRELSLIERLLRPDGACYLFYEPPAPARIPELASKVSAAFQANGFVVTGHATTTGPVPLLCVVARPAAAASAR